MTRRDSELLNQVFGAEQCIRILSGASNLTENQQAHIDEALRILEQVRKQLAR